MDLNRGERKPSLVESAVAHTDFVYLWVDSNRGLNWSQRISPCDRALRQSALADQFRSHGDDAKDAAPFVAINPGHLVARCGAPVIRSFGGEKTMKSLKAPSSSSASMGLAITAPACWKRDLQDALEVVFPGRYAIALDFKFLTDQ